MARKMERCSYAAQYYHRNQETALLHLVMYLQRNWNDNNIIPCQYVNEKSAIGRNTETLKKKKNLQFGG